VKILRDGKAKTLDLTLKELPGSDVAFNGRSDEPAESSDALAGVAVSDIDSAMRRQLELPANLNGAIITDVRPDSPAYEAGLRQGDVILEINRRPVKNSDDAVQFTENASDKRTLLRVWSKGGSRYVVVDETNVG